MRDMNCEKVSPSRMMSIASVRRVASTSSRSAMSIPGSGIQGPSAI